MCIPIAKQRLGKHIPTEANASKNRTSIIRQRISKYALLTIKVVFSPWSVQSGYKELFSSRVNSKVWSELLSEVERVQLKESCRELRRVLEMAVEGN
jgi:hypothetical protein